MASREQMGTNVEQGMIARTAVSMRGCLYMLKFPNGKGYVGISSRPATERFKDHRKHKNLLGNAIRKYGEESVLVETLVLADDWGYLCLLEKSAIVSFGTKCPNGYNLTDGGDGVVNPTAEARKAMSDGINRYFADPVNKKKHAEMKAAHGADPVIRKRMSDGLKLHWSKPGALERNRAAQKLVQNLPEKRAAASAKTKQYNAEHPEKLTAQALTLKEFYANPVNAVLHSSRMKAFYATDAGKLSIASMRASKTGTTRSEETKAKHKATLIRKKEAANGVS